jgi:hypothetical protein
VPVVRTARVLQNGLNVVANARVHRHPSNVRYRAYKKDEPWEIWLVPRFASCNPASQKPVPARS